MNTTNFRQTLNEKASILLRQLQEQSKYCQEKVIPLLQNQDWIPLHDMDCYGTIDDSELEPISNQTYIKLEDIEFLVNAVGSEKIALMVPFDDQGNEAHIFSMYVNDNKIMLDNLIFCDLSDTVETQLDTYVKCKQSINFMDDNNQEHSMFVDELMSTIINTDELNRVNQSVVTELAKGKEFNYDLISNISIQFSDCRDGTRRFISQLAGVATNGATGFFSLIKGMYSKISQGSTVSANGNVSFTDNSQFYVRDFTGGVINFLNNTISGAWSVTKSVLGSIGTIIGASIYGVSKIISYIGETIIDQYTSSKLDFGSIERNYAWGVLQVSLSRNNGQLGPIVWDYLAQAISAYGTLRFYMPWGSTIFWMDYDNPLLIYSETRLRTDILYSRNPVSIRFPTNSQNLGNAYPVTGANITSFISDIGFYHDSVAYPSRPTITNFVLSTYGESSLDTYSVLSAIDQCILTVSPLLESRTSFNEVDLAKRIYRAYNLLLSYILIIEARRLKLSTYTISTTSTDLFSFIKSNYPDLYRIATISYTIGILCCKLSPSGIIGSSVAVMTNTNAWSYINNNSICLPDASVTYPYIWEYGCVGLDGLKTLITYNYGAEARKVILLENDIISPSIVTSIYYFSPSESISEQYDTAFLLLFSLIFNDKHFFTYKNSQNNTNYYNYDVFQGLNAYFLTPPNYTRDDVIAGVMLIIGVVAGVIAVTSAALFAVKKAFAIKATKRAAEIEAAWSTVTDDPSLSNIKRYRKLVKSNNIKSRLFGGQIFSKTNYWSDTDSISLMSSISQLISGNNEDGESTSKVDLYKLIHG